MKQFDKGLMDVLVHEHQSLSHSVFQCPYCLLKWPVDYENVTGRVDEFRCNCCEVRFRLMLMSDDDRRFKFVGSTGSETVG